MRSIALLLIVGLVAPQARQPVQPTKFAPTAFFNAKCAKCHGENGSGYRANLSNGMTESKLEDKIVEMTDGNAQSPLANKDLAVLKSWFRAFLKKEPYVAWTEQSGSRLKFETSAGATLTATAGGRAISATSANGVWTLTLPSGVNASSVVVTSKKGDKSTQLSLSAAATSHSAPIRS